MKNKEVRPALPARIAAWGIAFLLTITLTVSALSVPAAANRIFTSEDLHVRTATEDTVIQEQMDKVTGTIRDLAEDYAFSADAVVSLLSRESFEEINRETARWWTRIVTGDGTGSGEESTTEESVLEIPVWEADPQIEDVIYNTLDKQKMPEETDREETAKGITAEIAKTVNRTVMPLRKALVTLAVRYASRKTDIPGMIRFVSRIPQIAVLASLLLAGLIALLTGKRIRFSLKYYGAAFAGAGLSALAGMILLYQADLIGMLRIASERLNNQLHSMMKTVELESWVAAAGLIVLGIICLICYNRKPVRTGKHGGTHETKQNDSPDPVSKDPGTPELRYRRRSPQRTV